MHHVVLSMTAFTIIRKLCFEVLWPDREALSMTVTLFHSFMSVLKR